MANVNKDKRYNGFALGVEFIGVAEGEVILEIRARRWAPKGKRFVTGSEVTAIRVNLQANLAVKLAEVAGMGLRKRVENAEAEVRSAQSWVDSLRRRVGA